MVGTCGADRCYKCVPGAGDYLICQYDMTGTLTTCNGNPCSGGTPPPTDKCAGKQCYDTCVGKDSYTQRCDPNTGGCVTGYLIRSNAPECGGSACQPPGGVQRRCESDNRTISVWNQVECRYDSQVCSTGHCTNGYCDTVGGTTTSVKVGVASGSGAIWVYKNGVNIDNITQYRGSVTYQMLSTDTLRLEARGESEAGYTFDKWCNSSGGNCSGENIVERTVGTGSLDYMAYFKTSGGGTPNIVFTGISWNGDNQYTAGEIIIITAHLRNDGTASGTASVEVKSDGVSIGTSSKSLSAGATGDVVFTYTAGSNIGLNIGSHTVCVYSGSRYSCVTGGLIVKSGGYTVNMTIIGNGSVTISSSTRATETVSASNSRTYSQFDEIHYNASGASGYQFTSFNIDGNVTTLPNAAIVAINANKNIIVTFTKIATGAIVLNSVQWATPSETLSKIRLNVTTNGSTSTYLKVDADAQKTLIYNSSTTYIDTTDVYTTAIPHGICIGTPTPTQCKNLAAVISDKCAGVVCSPATKCVNKDLYSMVCDSGTGNCVQGTLIQANSDKCDGTTPIYYRCDAVNKICIEDSTLTSNRDNCASAGQTCGDTGGGAKCPSGKTNLGGLLPECYTTINVAIVGGLVLFLLTRK